LADDREGRDSDLADKEAAAIGMPPGKQIAVDRRQSRAFITKAEEFLEGARASSEAGRNDAAMLDSIHAAISATDAVTCALGGIRSTDPNHARAADLLEEIGPKGEVASHARQLRQLLANKNTVEYESRRATARETADALKRAERFVSWASDVVVAARF
jgi:HEPN domain-containing protein